MFLEELDNYYASGLPIRRPNSMNNYGIIVNEVRGMCHPEGCFMAMCRHTQRTLLQRMMKRLMPGVAAQIGLRDMMTRLQQDILWPIARVLFPREGSEFNDHHSFMVQYKQVCVCRTPARMRVWSVTPPYAMFHIFQLVGRLVCLFHSLVR